ncbi:MAG: carbohydrate porin [Balneolaceae bacterium]
MRLVLLLLISINPSYIVLAQIEQSESENPVTVNVSYTGDVFANLTGGNETGFRYLDNIDVNFEIDFNHLPTGFNGTTFYVYGMGNQGGSISELTGDIQGVSNIEGDTSWRIFEVWAQKKFFITNSSLLLGLYDINSEFNVLNSSAIFKNSSYGLDPTIAFSGFNGMGPSTFPYTSLAARLKFNPVDGLVLQAAVLDGVPSDPVNPSGTKIKLRESDGLFLIGEASRHFMSQSDGDLQLRKRVTRLHSLLDRELETDNMIGFGGWYYSREKKPWNPVEEKDNEYGFYGFGEYQIINRKEFYLSDLKVFVRAGFANQKVNQLNGFLSGGLVATGLFENRPEDKTGIAAAYASASTSYLNNYTINGSRPENAETNIEFTHQFVWNDYLQIQGSFQYVINPGFDATLENTFVTGTRLIIGF